MKIIFVIGKYNADNPSKRSNNIIKARDAAELLWSKGYAVICPHTNSAHFRGSEEQFREGYKEILRRCADCILVLDNHRTSPGSLGEIEVAEMKRISIYYEMKDVPDLI